MSLADKFSNGEYQTAERMTKKLAAVPLPELKGKTVLDIGCDHGAWCRIAKDRGASRVIGIDRGRDVRGVGFVDLAQRNGQAHPDCEFYEYEVGREYPTHIASDIVFVLNMYHHAYNVVGDHEALWYWLSLITKEQLIWESPLDVTDGVANKDIRKELHDGYNEKVIRAAAERYFTVEDIGTGWVATRRVWRCTPKYDMVHTIATVKSGAGGASKAFAYANGRRIKEIEMVLGITPVPGSLNLEAAQPFDWNHRYFRAQILDVVNRRSGLDSEWAPRWCRFYPLFVEGDEYTRAWAMRFENEHYANGKPYPETLIELVSGYNFRENFWENGDEICLSSR